MVVWGGFRNDLANTGGRYDPGTDVWSATSTDNAPGGRAEHTAIRAGSDMIVWGGHDGTFRLTSGGRYDPAVDSWMSTSTVEAPTPRSEHTAVWTGSSMLVWGGTTGGAYLNSGGRYALGHSLDDDADGFSECDGDCNDDLPNVYPGAVEICDALDNDCNGATDDGAGPPGATSGLFYSSKDDLQWAPAPGGRAYDVIQGDLNLLRSSGGDFTASLLECLEDDSPDLTSADPSLPPAGTGVYHLIRTSGCGQNGTYDSGGPSQDAPRDSEIDASANACP